MSSLDEPSIRTMQPDALRMVKRVFQRIAAEGRLSKSAPKQDAFAAFLIRAFQRGMVIEGRLYAIGVTAAKARFCDIDAKEVPNFQFPLSKVLIIEDDYFLARHLKGIFERRGASILGPVRSQTDALSLLETEVPDVAVVDLNLGDGVNFKVAEVLFGQSVPFCVFTAYARANFKELPDSLQGVPWIEKPASAEALLNAAGRAVVQASSI